MYITFNRLFGKRVFFFKYLIGRPYKNAFLQVPINNNTIKITLKKKQIGVVLFLI